MDSSDCRIIPTALQFPLEIPGYGTIHTMMGWNVFLAQYQAQMAAFVRLRDNVSRLGLLVEPYDRKDV